MPGRAFRSGGLVFAVALLTAGCTASVAGTARSVTRSSSPASATPDAVPGVPAPLDLARFRRDPCAVVTPAELRVAGLVTPKPNLDQTPVALACDWTDDTVGVAGVQVAVGLQTALSGGLRDIYRQRGDMAYWQPVTVDGYPAVLADQNDGRATGTCRMDLGVTDLDVMLLSYDSDPGTQPCDKVRALGEAVVRSLKGPA